MNEYTIIQKPILTEKITLIREKQNIVVFKVAPNANKIQIKNAVQKIFNVTPEKVNVMNIRPKKQRLGQHIGEKSSWRKAIIKLKAGDKIDYFEGA